MFCLIVAVAVQAYCEDGTVCNGNCISPDYNGDCVKGMVTY